MLNNSLKLMIKFPTSKVSGYFTILFTKVGTYSQQKTIFTKIAKNCKTFPTVLNWALKVHAKFPRLLPKLLDSPEVLKNALKCTKMLNTTAGLGVRKIF